MEYGAGVVLGIVIGFVTSVVGMDRDRALYPAILIVIASYYVLFAIMGGGGPLIAEFSIAIAFLVAAIFSFRTNLWVAAAAIVAHGVQDLFHGQIVHNPGVPTWWPMFCASIDVVIGAYLAMRLISKQIEASHPSVATARRRAG